MLRPGKLVTQSMSRRFEGWSGRRAPRSCAVLLICAGLALTLGVAALFASSAPSFAPARSYPTGRGTTPNAVAIGDLNGDGKPELMTANWQASTVSILENTGAGGFKGKREYPTGRLPAAVAIGDLNDDGHADLATGNIEANTVSILRNRGNGTFRAKRDYRTGYGTESVAIGDLNADCKPDVGTSNDKTVSVLVNRGDGTFLARLDYPTGAIAGGRGTATVAIGDLNGDRNPDVASANYDRDKVSVLFNRPGLCDVQDVRQQTLSSAKRILLRANCRVGTIRHGYSKAAKRGRVISQRPKFGTVLPGGGKVNLVVSRGRS